MTLDDSTVNFVSGIVIISSGCVVKGAVYRFYFVLHCTRCYSVGREMSSLPDVGLRGEILTWLIGAVLSLLVTGPIIC